MIHVSFYSWISDDDHGINYSLGVIQGNVAAKRVVTFQDYIAQ